MKKEMRSTSDTGRVEGNARHTDKPHEEGNDETLPFIFSGVGRSFLTKNLDKEVVIW